LNERPHTETFLADFEMIEFLKGEDKVISESHFAATLGFDVGVHA
jgi:hypothetical protein